jgi:serine/threonine protein kinase
VEIVNHLKIFCVRLLLAMEVVRLLSYRLYAIALFLCVYGCYGALGSESQSVEDSFSDGNVEVRRNPELLDFRKTPIVTDMPECFDCAGIAAINLNLDGRPGLLLSDGAVSWEYLWSDPDNRAASPEGQTAVLRIPKQKPNKVNLNVDSDYETLGSPQHSSSPVAIKQFFQESDETESAEERQIATQAPDGSEDLESDDSIQKQTSIYNFISKDDEEEEVYGYLDPSTRQCPSSEKLDCILTEFLIQHELNHTNIPRAYYLVYLSTDDVDLLKEPKDLFDQMAEDFSGTALSSDFGLKAHSREKEENDEPSLLTGIVMEYIDGECFTDKYLYDHENGKTLITEHLLRHYANQLFSAVAYLHRHEVVHCDITPKNLLSSNSTGIKTYPSLYLIDFGEAKRTNKAWKLKDLDGSCRYRSPELRLLDGLEKYDVFIPKEILRASDVYACMLILLYTWMGIELIFPWFRNRDESKIAIGYDGLLPYISSIERFHELSPSGQCFFNEFFASGMNVSTILKNYRAEHNLDCLMHHTTSTSSGRRTARQLLVHPWIVGHNFNTTSA